MNFSSQLIDRVDERQPPLSGSGRHRTEVIDLPGDPVQAALARQRFAAFDLDYEAAEKTLFCSFTRRPRPCFSSAVLREAASLQRLLRGLFDAGTARAVPLRYLVLGSHNPGVWSWGGDLALIARLARARDRAGLRRYAEACCAIGHGNASGLGSDLPIVSVALVQGAALGGGFEAVLSSDFIIAERSARFGLPEILFNLFPGMGGYSFLARRIAPGLASRLVMSGRTYSAAELHALGVVDVLVPDGAGRAAFYDFIGRGGRRHAAQRALASARRLVDRVTLAELQRIAELWVEAALSLGEADLRRMERLLAAQERRRRLASAA